MSTTSASNYRASGRGASASKKSKSGSRVVTIAKQPPARGIVDLELLADDERYLTVYKASGIELVQFVKTRVHTNFVAELAEDMGQPRTFLVTRLGLPASTVRRRAATQEKLSTEESSRVLGLARIIGQVKAMVEESGGPPDFDAAHWVAQWIETPVPALGERKPSEFIDTAEGQAVVSQLLSQIQSGAYA